MTDVARHTVQDKLVEYQREREELLVGLHRVDGAIAATEEILVELALADAAEHSSNGRPAEPAEVAVNA